MARTWTLELRGGAYDEWQGKTEANPAEVLIAWQCSTHRQCPGHATFDPHNPNIELVTAESYRRTEVDIDDLLAVYEVGEPSPDGELEVEELVPVGAGADLGDGWPVSP